MSSTIAWGTVKFFEGARLQSGRKVGGMLPALAAEGCSSKRGLPYRLPLAHRTASSIFFRETFAPGREKNESQSISCSGSFSFPSATNRASWSDTNSGSTGTTRATQTPRSRTTSPSPPRTNRKYRLTFFLNSVRVTTLMSRILPPPYPPRFPHPFPAPSDAPSGIIALLWPSALTVPALVLAWPVLPLVPTRGTRFVCP